MMNSALFLAQSVIVWSTEAIVYHHSCQLKEETQEAQGNKEEAMKGRFSEEQITRSLHESIDMGVTAGAGVAGMVFRVRGVVQVVLGLCVACLADTVVVSVAVLVRIGE